jgi:hypothetical protein
MGGGRGGQDEGMRRIFSSVLALAVATAASALAAGAFAAAAMAHVPVLEPERSSDAPPAGEDPFPAALHLPDPSISRAVYGALAESEAFDAWAFEVPERIELPVQALVPAGDERRDFRPRLLLLGPGLPEPEGLPETIAERLTARPDWGAVVVEDPGAEPRPTFFEPFSLTTYFRGGETRVTVEGGRRYVLVVDEPSGRTGEYAIGIGEAESFTVAEALRAPLDVVRIKLGLYGQADLDLSALAGLIAIATGLGGLVAWLVLRRRRRSSAAEDAGRAGSRAAKV